MRRWIVLQAGDSFADLLAAAAAEHRGDQAVKLVGELGIRERILVMARRERELFDEPALMRITEAVEKDGQRASALVQQIVLSYPFQYQSNKDKVE